MLVVVVYGTAEIVFGAFLSPADEGIQRYESPLVVVNVKTESIQDEGADVVLFHAIFAELFERDLLDCFFEIVESLFKMFLFSTGEALYFGMVTFVNDIENVFRLFL